MWFERNGAWDYAETWIRRWERGFWGVIADFGRKICRRLLLSSSITFVHSLLLDKSNSVAVRTAKYFIFFIDKYYGV